MTTFAAPASTLDAKAPDPCKHVKYTFGMVLGVDDFNQDFAYLLGRQRWLASDAIGYGTLSGLRIGVETDAQKGPRLTVTSGSALTPRGQLVCVKPAQCAYLNEWLAANKKNVDELVGSPIASTIALYLTLCYRDCPVDLIPIPGEPCRTEDEILKPSRLVDDFVLDLRTAPPDQREEDLLREFAAWVRMLTFGGGGPYATLAQFEQALRGAVMTPSPPPSSLSGEVHFNFGSPLGSLQLDPLLAPEYFRVAFRVWSEEIRPRVHALCCGGGGCCNAHDTQEPKTDECLLLARIDVPVLRSSGNWVVDDTRNVTLDESRRPTLIHLRLLQELLGDEATDIAPPPATLGATTVAAGIVGPAGARQPVLNNLAAIKVDDARIRLAFTGYVAPAAASPPAGVQYVVKALAHTHAQVTNPLILVDAFANDGIVLRIVRGSNGQAFPPNAINTLDLSVEISRIG